uniref:DUF1330 domain-containing protein n=1 Tax=Alexandrium monilatum TaxID=311494 RepID=A0A7S4T2J5_9DINO
MAPSRRLAALARHVAVPEPGDTRISVSATAGSLGVRGKTAFNSAEVLKAFASDPEWAGKPVWMLNLLRFTGEGAGASDYAEYAKGMMSDVFPRFGGRAVMSGYCRTVIGQRGYHQVSIVEYPSPQAFVQMVTSGAQASKNEPRLKGLEEQYLIPVQPGWFHIDRPAPAPAKTFTHFTVDNVWATPGGLVGASARGARVGETSSAREQAEAFVADTKLGDDKIVWHLNLLHFKPGGGEETYSKYAKAMGGKSGTLSLFGARSVMAAKCFRSLIGEVSFDQAIIVEYPCRDSYLSMSASEEYMRTAHFRHEGLQDTYIISCLPELVDKTPPSPASVS